MELDFLINAVVQNASDIFIIPGLPLSYKINGEICQVNSQKLLPADTERLIRTIYQLSSNRSMEHLNLHGDDDLSCSIVGKARFRASIMKQRGSLAAVIRVVHFEIPMAAGQALHMEINPASSAVCAYYVYNKEDYAIDNRLPVWNGQ